MAGKRLSSDELLAITRGSYMICGARRHFDRRSAGMLPLRASGDLEGVTYEEIRYEGYGIGGAAIIVDCMTDNKTRTVADVRHAFSKHGGNLGTDGSVSFLFKHCGQMVFAPGTNEDKLMEAAIEAGAEDVVTNDDGSIEVITSPNDFTRVRG